MAHPIHRRQTEDHIALMVLRRDECKGMLFDGKEDESMESAALAACCVIAQILEAVEPGYLDTISDNFRDFHCFNFLNCQFFQITLVPEF